MRTFLRLPEVTRATGLTVTRIYESMRAGTFPKAIPIGPRAVAWDSEEIATWQEARLAEREAA